ncbi:MAG: PLP-dependent aminotransferase family protein [Candidatus Cloacimonadales bacterium]|jgi:2-aminoadipate transaminase|nr:PLP-dependent aminotransferase family protein [Candidatus Cloacimonadota bacterium]MDD2649973.1 PLP-dependent aminotransferase family protein [Candidatus Cloacimonadota bacterium]MDD3501557.1 PLP-dependent aminotransferase family protein [Candidatus Cloacimonadota bacterium]MDX9976507.1 PLP-dependent aminotransferase family protein [Candidatus Cloacimonadales bacterium]
MDLKSMYSNSTATMKSSMIRELVASTKGIPGLISFAGGFPSPATFPVSELAEIFKEVVESDGTDILQYGASEGDNFLKAEIKKWENKDYLKENEILIVDGATNGIFYFTQTMINPGDVIICEGPSFLGTLVAFEAAGAEVIPVSLDDEGINIEELEELLAKLKAENKTVKFIYTIPDFHNPTGVTMSLQRRHDLIKIAIKNSILILEDDPYSQLRYTGEFIKGLYDIARENYNNSKVVTVVKSFSKILGPGLRVAYVLADNDLIQPMISWLQKVIVSPNCVAERAVAKYMQKDKLNPHVKKIQEFYAPYMDAMLKALEKYMPKEVKWPQIEGGIFIWLTCPEHINTDELFEKAKEMKISFIPGSKFYPSNHERYNALRLNFSYPSIEQIDTGVKALGDLLKSMI